MLEAHLHELAEKQLLNLRRHEARLRREYRRQTEELDRLQKEAERGKVDPLFDRWYAARKALKATEEETDYFEQ
jgi:hypothetical protein